MTRTWFYVFLFLTKASEFFFSRRLLCKPTIKFVHARIRYRCKQIIIYPSSRRSPNNSRSHSHTSTFLLFIRRWQHVSNLFDQAGLVVTCAGRRQCFIVSGLAQLIVQCIQEKCRQRVESVCRWTTSIPVSKRWSTQWGKENDHKIRFLRKFTTLDGGR